MFLKNIKVGTKIIAMVVILSGTMLTIGTIGINGMRHSGNAIGHVYENQLLPVSELAETNDLISEAFIQLAVAAQHDTRLAESSAHTHPITFHTDQVDSALKKIDEIWHQYVGNKLTDKEKILVEKFDVTRQKILPSIRKSVELLKSGEYQQANVHFVQELIPAFKAFGGLVDELKQTKIALSKVETDKVFDQYLVARNFGSATIGFGLLLAITMGWWLVRAITRPLREAVAISDRIAHGDLTAEIRMDSGDETGQLLRAMRSMATQLKEMVGKVTQSTDTVNSTAAE
ncbi:MAG TPA: methyl-accepting chemotaxis protein, partial [Candidatus Competibacter sp.]|nr:methyl-accepting chemotaxis protein [Candidatus Competibacter sp.]